MTYRLRPTSRSTRRGLRLGAAATVIAALAATSAPANTLGPSFVKAAELGFGGASKGYDSWLRVEGFYWKTDKPRGSAIPRRGGEPRFPAPTGPAKGTGELVLAIDKKNPGLPKLMQACARGAVLPELTLAVDAMRNQPVGTSWTKPDDVPAFYEYGLKNLKISDCPVVADAPEQAIVLSFADITWLNYAGDPQGQPVKVQPASLPVLQTSGSSRTYLVSWFAVGNYVSTEQCAAFNKPPSEELYYELLPTDQAEKEKAERVAKGGVSYQDGSMELRGPSRLNAVLLPGIVRDPGQIEPKSKIAIGLDLDGDDGTGKPPAGICKHDNFLSSDGRSGIDNQLFRVQGCNTGYQGRKGYLMQYANEQRRNSKRQILIHLTGIDDLRNDDRIDITFLYSPDAAPKSSDGSTILSDYTFSVGKDLDFTQHFRGLSGKIVDGVVVARSNEQLVLTDFLGASFHNPVVRMELTPQGGLKGVIGGYVDWRKTLEVSQASSREYNHGLNIPAWYNAFKRYADGLKDPVTGQCNGISTAHEIEAVPAYIPPLQQTSLARLKR